MRCAFMPGVSGYRVPKFRIFGALNVNIKITARLDCCDSFASLLGFYIVIMIYPGQVRVIISYFDGSDGSNLLFFFVCSCRE